jgi:hypothetical protein
MRNEAAIETAIGLRYSNEFYFATPAGWVNISEIPVQCGLERLEQRPEGERAGLFEMLRSSSLEPASRE